MYLFTSPIKRFVIGVRELINDVIVQCLRLFQVAPAKNTLRINNQTLGTFRGGSLPNVSAGTPTIKSASHIKDVAKVNLVTVVARVAFAQFVFAV